MSECICVCVCVHVYVIGPLPKGVIFEECSSLHCSNLLELYYVTWYIHIERDTHLYTHLTHITLLSERAFPFNLCLGSLGKSFEKKGNLCVQLAKYEKQRKAEWERNLWDENKRHEGSVIVWLFPLKADQIMLSAVMLK